MLFLATAIADTGWTDAELEIMATTFIEAKNARQQPDTTVEDVDRFIALLADDFVDEHVKFNVTVSDKNELRDGMIAKMNDEIFYSEIDIDEIMTGGNVAIVKYTERARVKPAHLDRIVEYTSTHIVTLEFDSDGLIRHIRRHHGN